PRCRARGGNCAAARLGALSVADRTIRDLFADSLRMRPDRILVGEVRRGEALDLVQSMLSDHDGALSTVHASTPLLRLETLCLMTPAHLPVSVAGTQVASAIQVVALVSRFADGSRRVAAIHEVAGLGPGEKYRLRPLFEFRHGGTDPDGRVRGALQATGRRA